MNTIGKTMCISLLLPIAGCLLVSDAWAEQDSTRDHQIEFLTVLGVAGQPAQKADEFRHASGAYICMNAATRSTPHIVRYPFMLPDSHRITDVTITGRLTYDAPPMTLKVRKSCMAWHEINPTTTTLAQTTRWQDPNNPEVVFTSRMPVGANERPNNYDCKYWVQAEFDISSRKCTTGEAAVQKIRVESVIADRIFRGNFGVNYPYEL